MYNYFPISEEQLKKNYEYQQEELEKNPDAVILHRVYKKLCPVCGKEFLTEDKTKKYCSSGMLMSNIETGEMFWTKGCYEQAQLQMQKERRANKVKDVAICKCCGSSFLKGRTDQQYCSKACKQKTYRMKSRSVADK